MQKEPQLTYSEAMAQADREARSTVVAAFTVTVFFWAAVGIFSTQGASFVALPLWFWISCIGGYVVSVLAVMALVRFGMKNFDLEVACRTTRKEE